MEGNIFNLLQFVDVETQWVHYVFNISSTMCNTCNWLRQSIEWDSDAIREVANSRRCSPCIDVLCYHTLANRFNNSRESISWRFVLFGSTAWFGGATVFGCRLAWGRGTSVWVLRKSGIGQNRTDSDFEHGNGHFWDVIDPRRQVKSTKDFPQSIVKKEKR